MTGSGMNGSNMPNADGTGAERSANGDPGRPRVGDVLAGKYRVEKVIGEGGMGVVFAARHVALDQLVAVKVLLADAAKGDTNVERFVREAQAAARLQSEHVARVMDAGTLENGVPFLAMEYLEGCDLEELLKLNRQLSVTDAADYVLQALAAMGQAHAAGIVHRDLKPSNLYLALRPDGTNIIKILDFGISKQTTAREGEKALTGRAVLGSPAYMPPEQLRNAKLVDTRADLWALGIVLYEMLTGGPPFDGEGVGEIFAAILEKDPQPIRKFRPDVSEELEQIVFMCLRRDVEERWQTAADLARALVPYGSGKWSGVVEGIELTQARSSRMMKVRTSVTARNLIAVANQVLKRSRPPGAITDDATGRVAFARNDGPNGNPQALLQDSEPSEVPPIPVPGKRARAGAKLVLTAALFAIFALVVRGYMRPVPPAGGTASSDSTTAVAAAPAPAPVELAKSPEIDTPAARTMEIIELPSSATQTREVDAGTAAPTAAASTVRASPQRPKAAQNPTPGKPSTRPKFLNTRD